MGKKSVVVESVRAGNVQHAWHTLPSGLIVSRDAVKVGGARRAFTPEEALEVVELMGGDLLTPEELDERWENIDIKLDPITMDIDSPKSTDIEHSRRIDEQLAELGYWAEGQAVAGTGKPYCRGPSGICVYGWHVIKHTNGKWKHPDGWSMKVHAPASTKTKSYVIQRPYYKHGMKHKDYSSLLVMKKRVAAVPSRVVPRIDTPIGVLELAQVLRNGHLGVFGTLPSWERTGVAWAQCMLESGRGKRMWNCNFGNITAGSKWTGQYYIMKVPPPDPPTLKFRSHVDHHDGAKDYWQMLGNRYITTLPFFDAGDPGGAAAALKARGYFTADLAPYAKGMEGLYKEFWKKIQPVL